MKPIRLLEAHEIDVRVGQVLKDGNGGAVSVTLLLYKDARCDMAILDELFGPFGWKRTHTVVNANLFCTVEVRDPETGEWIAKQDVGTESNTEPQKGEASDSFKRACVNWGIGRELYTAPRIKVELRDREYSSGPGPVRCWQKFFVSRITSDEGRNITDLEIIDSLGDVRFSMGRKVAGIAQKKAKSAPSVSNTGKPSTTTAKALETAGNSPQEKYQDDKIFWSLVKCEADGVPSKTGETCREWFISHRQPSAAELAYFDNMVALRRSAMKQ